MGVSAREVSVQGDLCLGGGLYQGDPLHSPPPVDRKTPVKILPCPKLRLRAVIMHLNYNYLFQTPQDHLTAIRTFRHKQLIRHCELIVDPAMWPHHSIDHLSRSSWYYTFHLTQFKG